MKQLLNSFSKISIFAISISLASGAMAAKTKFEDLVVKSGHSSLQHLLMPSEVPYPEGNAPTEARVDLGKKLFFDPRLSGDGNMACASCHSPLFGWSDGLSTAKGFKSKELGRASPTIFNTAYQKIQMWDGRKKSLEDQALGPMVSSDEMNIGVDGALDFIKKNVEYSALFEAAYPGEGVSDKTLAKAIASFERTVLSNNTPFDQWVKGDDKAISVQAANGFKLFMDPNKGNCAVCHSGSNFADDGFHNIGLASYGKENPDLGRYVIKPIRILKGAFKTPTIREIGQTAPYFHDGSAKTLEEVVEHYAKGGVVKTSLSPNMKTLNLNEQEKADIVAFLQTLTSVEKSFELPVLPK
jgi:cytochrome c peroxidase